MTNFQAAPANLLKTSCEFDTSIRLLSEPYFPTLPYFYVVLQLFLDIALL